MRVKVLAAIVMAALFAGAPAAAATVNLTGETVTLRYLFPDVNTELSGYGFPRTVTVAAGTSDLVTDSFPGGPFFSVNIEPTSIQVTFLQNTIFWPPSPFDGFGVFGLTQKIHSFTEISAFGNIVSLSGKTVLFNFAGPQVYAAGSTVTADFSVAAVPLPVGAGLLAAGLAALGLLRRRRTA